MAVGWLLLAAVCSLGHGKFLKTGKNIGISFGTRNAVTNIAAKYEVDTREQTQFVTDIEGGSENAIEVKLDCISNRNVDPTEEKENSNLLDIVNFMEFVQTSSSSSEVGREVAENYYNAAVAAMEWGNTITAQENMARAIAALENYNRRRKRDDDGAWSAEDLFDMFRENMGEENLKKLLHLEKSVNIAFVIDTSSSMSNDMAHVRSYIAQIIEEQERAGVSATYYVTTFADPSVTAPRTFRSREALEGFLSEMQPSIGGDCEEKTCTGIFYMLYSSSFMRLGNAAMYVFTDASSKDCTYLSSNIASTFQALRISVFFILFDSCKPTVDNNYVVIAEKTGGFCLLIRENSVYNITDTVNGAFERDALIAGEQSDNSNSVVGQGSNSASRKRREADPRGRGRNRNRGRAEGIIDNPVRQPLPAITDLDPSELEDPSDGDVSDLEHPSESELPDLEDPSESELPDLEDPSEDDLLPNPDDLLPDLEEPSEEDTEGDDDLSSGGTVSMLEKEILVDTSIERFRVIVSVTPTSLLSAVQVMIPVEEANDPLCGKLGDGIDNINITRSLADTNAVFDVRTRSCQCTGYWRLSYPESVDSISYYVKSSGEYLIEFESYFVDETGPAVIANYAPCLGIKEYLVIKVTQYEKINPATLTAKLVAVAGNVVQWEGTLSEYQEDQYSGAFVIPLTIPPDMGTEGFRVFLEGSLVNGVRFQRISGSYFYPTRSCMRMTEVLLSSSPSHTLKQKKKTYVYVSVSNNGEQGDLHLLTCRNSRNYPTTVGNPTKITGPGSSRNNNNYHGQSNPVYLEPGQTAEFAVTVNAPRNKREMEHGRTVAVTCEMTTTIDRILDSVRLTEMTGN